MENKQSILYLTLNKEAFEVMVTGEKDMEFRKPSNWIKARLNGPNSYNVIQFTNGYGNDKPSFTVEYKGHYEYEFEKPWVKKYSNGLEVTVEPKDIVILLGKVLEIKNYTI